MGSLACQTVTVIVVGVLIAKYFKSTPSMSETLQTWISEGYYYNHKGREIFYRDDVGERPDGPALVCLHGFPSLSYDWLKVWPALTAKFGRVVAMDFVGFGFSTKSPDMNFTIAEQADVVEGMLGSLRMREVHLLAHDYGDTVAQELIARYEDRVREGREGEGPVLKSACLLNGGIFPETNFPRLAQKALLVPYLGELLQHLASFLVFKRSFGEVFGPESQPSEEEFEDFWYGMTYNNGNAVMHKVIRFVNERREKRNRWVGALQQTNLPVHVIYGPADPVNPPAFVEYYKSVVPHSDVTILDDQIGHYPQWEAPSATMRAYFSFLRRSTDYKSKS